MRTVMSPFFNIANQPRFTLKSAVG